MPISAVSIEQIALALRVSKRQAQRRANANKWAFVEQQGLGGKRRAYAFTGLPAEVQSVLLLNNGTAQPVTAPISPAPKPHAVVTANAWERFANAGEDLKARAERMAAALDAVLALRREGSGLGAARHQVAAALEAEGFGACSAASLRRWAALTEGAPRADWAALLLPGYVGGGNHADCELVVWDWYKGHYLTRAKPSHADTYARCKEMAEAQGWAIPSQRTLERKMAAEVTRATQVLLREGREAARLLLPTMQRDALALAVGEGVNGDGIKFDRLWVKFEDGEVINTATAWVWQDIHSRKILAWRLAKTENTDVFRLATYDLTAVCAPEFVLVDNTRVAANKLMTAGTPGRHRFKSDPDDGMGLLTMLGMQVHFTDPSKDTGNPGAKPIERAFGQGGLHEMVAKSPKVIARNGFSKATAIDVALLREVIAEEVGRFNAKPLRRTQACRGVLSFDQAWQEGMKGQVARVLSETQRNLLLMSREVIRADRRGELRIEAGRGPWGKNAYWCEHLTQYAGRKLAVHFDPENLGAGAHVYSLDGRYLFAADHIPRAAFNDTQTGREWSKFKRRVHKANKIAAENEIRMDAIERDALYQNAKPDAPTPAPEVASTVVTGHFQRVPNPERDALPRTGTDDARESKFASLLERIQAQQMKDQL